jgi:hypothetical protein
VIIGSERDASDEGECQSDHADLQAILHRETLN